MNSYPMRLFRIAKESALEADKGSSAIQADAAVFVFGFDQAVRAKLSVLWGLLGKGRPLLTDAGKLNHFRFSKYVSMARRMISATVSPVRLASALSLPMTCSGRW